MTSSDELRKVKELEFSQPTRQIFLMVLVLILVFVGAYFMFPSISPIFLSAPYLNGFIVGVFILGIFACFFQTPKENKATWFFLSDFDEQRNGFLTFLRFSKKNE